MTEDRFTSVWDALEDSSAEAANMKELVETKGGNDSLKHHVLACIFYEPSTRTSCSFQAAMLRLGGSVISGISNSAALESYLNYSLFINQSMKFIRVPKKVNL
jgi:aspartate carbamoyltransferase catalytic subunit